MRICFEVVDRLGRRVLKVKEWMGMENWRAFR